MYLFYLTKYILVKVATLWRIEQLIRGSVYNGTSFNGILEGITSFNTFQSSTSHMNLYYYRANEGDYFYIGMNMCNF